MVKPLTFKGDKKAKKRKRAEPADETSANDSSVKPSKALATQDAHTAEDGGDMDWVPAELPSDISGPIVIVLPSSPLSFLATDAHGAIFTSAVENIVEGDPNTTEPHDVRQVWVANRIVGQEAFSLRGHHGKYLGCDKFGALAAVREAVGPEESFVMVPAPDMAGAFCIQTIRERFLAVDEKHEAKKPELRGDEENVAFHTTFRIRMQARFKPKLKASKEEKSLQKISRKELEAAVGRDLEDDEIKMLKKARREGNYHEALLDVKVKGKHDKFA